MNNNSSIEWKYMSDVDIITQIGKFVKHTRLKQNVTQAKLAENASIHRNTVSQLEKGEPVSLIILIQILRVLDVLYVFNDFNFSEEISPLEYAKLKKNQRKRASDNNLDNENKEIIGW